MLVALHYNVLVLLVVFKVSTVKVLSKIKHRCKQIENRACENTEAM